MERDDATGIARITLDDPERKNAYDPPMRRQLGAFLEEFAWDDDVKVVLLRGEGGVFSTGADMNNAYAWYGDRSLRRRARSPAVRASGAASWSTARRSTSTTSSWATRRSPWPRSRASRWAAASSSR